MKLPAPKAVIFDWDNTLVDTWPVIHQALQETFLHFGRETWTLDETRSRVSWSMRDSFPRLFGEQWEEAGKVYQEKYRASHLEQLKALHEAEEILKLLDARGVPLFIVSNKKGATLRKEVQHLGWEKYFSGVIGADDAARDKPHADPALLALSSLEMEAGKDVWFVGDSELDLACAAAAGCTPILFGPHAAAHAEYTPTHYLGHAYALHVKGHGELAGFL